MSQPNDTQQRILDSARDLIYTRSYADVGVAEICERAQVKKGSFYHFFPSKRDLTLKVLEAAFHDFKHQLVGKAFQPDVPPMARLERFIEMGIRFQMDMHEQIGMVPGCQFGNLAAELATQDDVLRSKVDGIFDQMQAAIGQLLEEARQVGEVGDIDVPRTAEAMLAYLEGVLLLAKSRNDPQVLWQLLPAMRDIRIAPEAGES